MAMDKPLNHFTDGRTGRTEKPTLRPPVSSGTGFLDFMKTRVWAVLNGIKAVFSDLNLV